MKNYFVIGLMSGTSLDGLDICYTKFTFDKKWTFEILEAETVFYEAFWKEKLRESIAISSLELLRLDIEFAQFLGEETQRFIEKYKLSTIDLISSHGHTVFHQPEKGMTLQIGDGRWISKKTNQTVVYDFRSQDVILGGQGAPLVPIGDELLFSDYDYCLNLGGFSNISFKKGGKRLAYDISPVNIILNKLAELKGLNYDVDGQIAKKGNVATSLLEELNKVSFYSKKYPKSLGVEWLNKEIIPVLQGDFNTIEDQMATFVEHIAFQISQHIKENKKILCTGGGTQNVFLMDRIRFYCKGKIMIPSEELINYKEALIFSFLGVLKIRNEINVLKSVTGADKNHSSGIVYNC